MLPVYGSPSYTVYGGGFMSWVHGSVAFQKTRLHLPPTPFSPPILPPPPSFFSFHFLQFLVLFFSSLLIWSRQTRDGYSRTTSIRTTPPSLSNRFVNSCKDSSFGIDTIFYDFCTLFQIFIRFFLGLMMIMMMYSPCEY